MLVSLIQLCLAAPVCQHWGGLITGLLFVSNLGIVAAKGGL